MGLSIHYRGKIKEYAAIITMVEELIDICRTLDWKYKVFEIEISSQKNYETNPQSFSVNDLKGLSIIPTKCEPVCLTFLPNLHLASPLKLLTGRSDSEDLEMEWVSTKTQFAGPEVHMAVLKLLDYIRKKYFSNFELVDEGDYWNTWDENRLKKQFSRYEILLDTVAAALEEIRLSEADTPDSIIKKIEEVLQKKKDKGDFSSKD